MKEFLKKEAENSIRQELPTYYRLNGALFFGSNDYFRKQRKFIGEKTFAYIMPKEKSIDIDDEFDFKIAEYMMSQLH